MPETKDNVHESAVGEDGGDVPEAPLSNPRPAGAVGTVSRTSPSASPGIKRRLYTALVKSSNWIYFLCVI